MGLIYGITWLIVIWVVKGLGSCDLVSTPHTSWGRGRDGGGREKC